jgi:SH3 domain protein
MTRGASLWLLTLTLAAPAVRAETVYVVEQLVVSLAASPEADAEHVGQVKSGDKLELLERQGEEVHVRLSNGTEGWIKSSYVSSDPPLAQRLSERTAEIDKLKQESQHLKQEGDTLRQEGERLKQDITRLQAQLADSHSHSATATPPEPTHESVFLRQPERSGQTPWLLLVGIAGVMLLVGFVLGWTTLDRRIRQKYGGLRIY